MVLKSKYLQESFELKHFQSWDTFRGNITLRKRKVVTTGKFTFLPHRSWNDMKEIHVFHVSLDQAL